MGETDPINPRRTTMSNAHSQRKMTMFRKLTLAAAAAAAISATALAPTSASAGGFYFPHHNHHHFGYGHGFGVGFAGGGGYGGCFVTRRVLTPFGFRWRTVNVCY
jgi:hypothetical protein